LYRAVAEHLDSVTALARTIRDYRDDRAFGVIAERLIDLVANCKFGGHGESFRTQALRAVRPKWGFFAIGMASFGSRTYCRTTLTIVVSMSIISSSTAAPTAAWRQGDL
jgi:hypothetical protein